MDPLVERAVGGEKAQQITFAGDPLKAGSVRRMSLEDETKRTSLQRCSFLIFHKLRPAQSRFFRRRTERLSLTTTLASQARKYGLGLIFAIVLVATVTTRHTGDGDTPRTRAIARTDRMTTAAL